MTENEAIERVKEFGLHHAIGDLPNSMLTVKAFEMAINALIVDETREQAEEYARGLSAEQVYADMLYKIVEAPTRIHMMVSARMLIPVIDQKLQSAETEG